jgi:hypothetical protein
MTVITKTQIKNKVNTLHLLTVHQATLQQIIKITFKAKKDS